MEQLADVAPTTPSLAAPESQTGDQLVAVIKPVDSAVREQIIAVPKVFMAIPLSSYGSPRAAEVPTTLFFLKQTVDTRGGYGGLSRFSSRTGFFAAHW